jgi:hypothetical protein
VPAARCVQHGTLRDSRVISSTFSSLSLRDLSLSVSGALMLTHVRGRGRHRHIGIEPPADAKLITGGNFTLLPAD